MTIEQAQTLSYAPADQTGPLVLKKVSRRLIPFIGILYLLGYLDRVNLGFAQLQMAGDLKFSSTVYGLGAGIFYIGYFLFEVPSNLLLERIGARIWIARIMITWGFVAAGMSLVRGPISFYSLRFLLGVAEAGFFPGMVLYLSYWFPPAHRARATALFFTSTAIAGVIGGPVSGLLLNMDGVSGLRGWQWLFLLEGIPSILVGITVYFFLTDKPADAHWLTEPQRHWLIHELARTAPPAGQTRSHGYGALRMALLDGRLWLLSGIYFMMMIGLYGVSYWMPRIIKTLTGFTDLKVGMVSAIPYALAVVGMVLIGRQSDRTGERRWHVAGSCLLCAAGFGLLPLCHSFPTGIAACSLATIGIWSAIGPFWAVPGEFLHGTAAAGGIAAINSIGCLGGFVGPYLVGWLKDHSKDFTSGLLMVSGALVAAAAMIVQLRRDRSVA
jgi:ACS family tartrate transporter-like MFS transporter